MLHLRNRRDQGSPSKGTSKGSNASSSRGCRGRVVTSAGIVFVEVVFESIPSSSYSHHDMIPKDLWQERHNLSLLSEAFMNEAVKRMINEKYLHGQRWGFLCLQFDTFHQRLWSWDTEKDTYICSVDRRPGQERDKKSDSSVVCKAGKRGRQWEVSEKFGSQKDKFVRLEENRLRIVFPSD